MPGEPVLAPIPPGWGVVLPVKGGAGAKSRLGPSGSPALALAMALDCLAAVLACRAVADVVVVTGDAGVADAVRALGARVAGDPGGGLDAAASAGLSALDAERPRAVLLADLPCLRSRDLEEALAAASAHPAAVVPDADGAGTVLLAQAAGVAITTAFGPGSAERHTAGGAVRLDLALPRLRRDVDVAADLAEAVALGVGPRTALALA